MTFIMFRYVSCQRYAQILLRPIQFVPGLIPHDSLKGLVLSQEFETFEG